ncbi:MAG: DinB family protein [Thermoflexales bacterium]|nr:DinB family protein [Thermoflexales bacterium]
MTEASGALADKLLSEGERTLAFFHALSADAWAQAVYGEGAAWTVAQALEHLVIAEVTLLRVLRDVAAGGPGAPPEIDIDRFNAQRTGSLQADPAGLMDAFRAGRQRIADFTRGLDEAQLARHGRHPAMGDSALGDMIKMIHLHASMHVRDIRRQLG